MVGTMAHEMDFANLLQVIGKESGWDEYIKETILCRFLATRDNADGLLDEFKDFLAEQRAREAELDEEHDHLFGIAEEDEEEDDEDEEEDEEDDEDFDDGYDDDEDEDDADDADDFGDDDLDDDDDDLDDDDDEEDDEPI